VAHGLTRERGLGVTPKPARETRALPGRNMPPRRGWGIFGLGFYKDGAPTALEVQRKGTKKKFTSAVKQNFYRGVSLISGKKSNAIYQTNLGIGCLALVPFPTLLVLGYLTFSFNWPFALCAL
jgi:hypothetical protein